MLYYSVPRGLSSKVIKQVFPIHDQEALKELNRSWVRNVFKRQPIRESFSSLPRGMCSCFVLQFLGEIADYFGIKIAFYFCWLGHYTAALFIPAAVGMVIWVSGSRS